MTERPPDDAERSEPPGDRDRLLRAAARGEPLHGDVVVELQPTGVMGTLAQMSLTEIMQMMDFGKKTARVDVFVTEAHGAVHVHDGQIVRAAATSSSGDVYGEPAFLLLCREHAGFFRIHYEREEVERNVQRPTTFVLLDALRTIDEAAAADAPLGVPGFDEAFGAGGGHAGDGLGLGDGDGDGDDDDDDAPPDDAPAEQLQQEPRYPCALDAEVDGVAHVLDDIGLGGAFLRSPAPRDPGSTVELCVTVPGGLPLELLATVVHALDVDTAAQRGRNPGMGVRFDATSMSDAAHARLRELVDVIASSELAGPAGLMPPEGAADDAAPEDTLALPGSSMLDSIAEVDFLIATGDLKGAQRLLLQAHDTAPDDEDISRRLRNVTAQIAAAEAIAYLQHAEHMVGKPEALEHARRATKLWPSREVLLRALSVFAHARSPADIADTAGRLMELDPEDEGAMRTWLDANVELQRWNVAVRTAEALLRRRPGDEELRALLQRLVQRARNR